MIINIDGKIDVKLIWTDAGNEDGKEEPALFLYRKAVKGVSAIIPQSCAYKYADALTQQEMHDLFLSCINIAKALRMPMDGKRQIHRSVFQVHCAIQDHLDELVMAMPKETPARYKGEATLLANGEKVLSGDVKV